MEMRKLSFDQLKEQIMQDEENQVFTEQAFIDGSHLRVLIHLRVLGLQ